jgi:hypothetical protein
MIGRREFISLLGGAAAAWPVAAQPVQRIGVFTNLAADDPESQARIGAFLQGLQQSGWIIGSNVRIDYRWGLPTTHAITNMRQSWSLSVRMSSYALLVQP